MDDGGTPALLGGCGDVGEVGDDASLGVVGGVEDGVDGEWVERGGVDGSEEGRRKEPVEERKEEILDVFVPQNICLGGGGGGLGGRSGSGRAGLRIDLRAGAVGVRDPAGACTSSGLRERLVWVCRCSLRCLLLAISGAGSAAAAEQVLHEMPDLSDEVRRRLVLVRLPEDDEVGDEDRQ